MMRFKHSMARASSSEHSWAVVPVRVYRFCTSERGKRAQIVVNCADCVTASNLSVSEYANTPNTGDCSDGGCDIENLISHEHHKMSAFVVAIPSYKRAELLVKKTLPFLARGGIKPNTIHIFVANVTEAKHYRDIVPVSMYGKIVAGKIGIGPQRRFIAKYFKAGTNVLSVDDDIDELRRPDSTRRRFVPIPGVHDFVKRAFERLHKLDLFMWGIYPVQNVFFMKDRVTTGLCFIVGTFYGFISRPSIKSLWPTVSVKEDVEQSIRYHIHDGAVMRFDNVTVKTRYFNPVGGVGSGVARNTKNEESAKRIVALFPEYATLRRRANGMAEIRLSTHVLKNVPPQLK